MPRPRPQLWLRRTTIAIIANLIPPGARGINLNLKLLCISTGRILLVPMHSYFEGLLVGLELRSARFTRWLFNASIYLRNAPRSVFNVFTFEFESILQLGCLMYMHMHMHL